MLIGALVVALTLFCCSAVSADDEWTEQQVQQSKQWKDGKSPLIFTKSGCLPDSYLNALLEAIRGSNVAHFKVLCQGMSSEDEAVCQSLTKHHVSVRSGGTVEGVDANYDSEAAFVSSMLESLLFFSITKLWSYSDLTNYSTQHPQHLLTVTPSSEEYAALLSAMLVKPLPLGVAMTAGVLPLSQRGQYSPPPSLLRLWYIVQGKYWYSNQDMSGFNLEVVQRCKTHVQLIKEFVERVHHPIVTYYKDDETLRRQFTGSGLHMAIVFPGQGDPDPESVAVSIAQATFMNYAFVIMPDRSRLRRFIADARPSLHIIVLPYGQRKDLLRYLVEGTYLVHEVRQITYSLRTFAVEHPRSEDGSEVYANLGPSITTDSEIKKSVMATRKQNHLFAYFCLQGSQRCVQVGYKVVHEVLSVIRVTDLGKTLAAHVVVYKSQKIKPFKLKNFTTCALYNSTTKAWTVATENITSGSEAVRFLSKLTGRRELAEVARAMIHATLTLAEVPPPPKPLQEDDTLNLVAISMPDPTIPKEIQLTSYNFQQNIAKFDKTAVVFCVRWSSRCQMFLHQTIAAHTQLQLTNALNVSLGVIGCDNYTEICFRYQIKAYPTVLLFTPSTINNPSLLTGTLDSTQLLMVLGQYEDKLGSLVELTPKSLPALLASGAGLDSTLVLWCDRDASSDMAETFRQQVSNNPHADLAFAWINSTNHSHLLSYIVPGITTFPIVIALSFKKHDVHLLAVEQSRETFNNKLSSFLRDLRRGTLEVFGYLPNKVWSPMQPPIPFPSTNRTHHSHHKSKTDDNSQYPKSADSTPSSGHQHQHTEL